MIGLPEIVFLLGLFVLIAPGIIVLAIIFRNRAKKVRPGDSPPPKNQ
jgi:hypothetical protein